MVNDLKRFDLIMNLKKNIQKVVNKFKILVCYLSDLDKVFFLGSIILSLLFIYGIVNIPCILESDTTSITKNIYFELGSTSVNTNLQENKSLTSELDLFTENLNSDSSCNLSIEGYSDYIPVNKTSNQIPDNMLLSFLRAENSSKWVVEELVKHDNIKVVTHISAFSNQVIQDNNLSNRRVAKFDLKCSNVCPTFSIIKWLKVKIN